MKVLACVPHFFGRSASNPNMLGSAKSPVEERASTVSQSLRWLSSIFLTQVSLGTSGRTLGEEDNTIVVLDEAVPTETQITGDIFVVTHSDQHLFDKFSTTHIVKKAVSTKDPTHLGYSCLELFAAYVENYDLFLFMEDDIAIYDDKFFHKIQSFYENFGDGMILSPNRYELWGQKDGAWKVYIEGAAPPGMSVPIQPDWQQEIQLQGAYGTIGLEIASNPMSACFVLTRNQIKNWMRYPDFFRPDPHMASSMLIMEAVQLPLAGRLPIYKPKEPYRSFLEVHHLPNRLSWMHTPSAKIRAIAEGDLAVKAARVF